MTVACSHEVAAWNQVCLVGSGAGCHFHPLVILTRLWRGLATLIAAAASGLGGGTVNHSTSPLCLLPSVSLFVCLSVRVSLLLSVSPSQRHPHMRVKSAGTAWSEIPSQTADIAVDAPHPNRPSRDDLCVHAHTYIYVRPDTHTHIIKALFTWGNWKEAFPISSLALSCHGGECASTYALQILTYRKKRYRKKKKRGVEVHNHLKLTASLQNSICVDHLWALWQRHIWPRCTCVFNSTL